MRNVEIVQRIAQELGSTTAQAETAVEALLAAVKAALQQGKPVTLRHLDTWQVRDTRAPMGRTPRTGAAAAIAARRVVRFTASQMLKQAVAGAVPPPLGRSDAAGWPPWCAACQATA